MNVLVACERSQTVTKAFRALGHNAYSCDIQACTGGHPEWHYQMDVIFKLGMNNTPWDLIIAHPPCTRLCNSGVRWLAERDLWQEMKEACRFFKLFQIMGEMGLPVAIENPIPHKYATELIGKYTQIIQPWQFGHGETKATCLWLYNLPKLKPTNIVEGREQRIWKMPPGKDRSDMRSKTFEGIAQAMAEQWTEQTISDFKNSRKAESPVGLEKQSQKINTNLDAPDKDKEQVFCQAHVSRSGDDGCYEDDYDDKDWPVFCDDCGGEDGDHDIRCPKNESPFAQLLRDGYD